MDVAAFRMNKFLTILEYDALHFQLFNREINPYLNQEEFDACLEEFRADYNQTHFVRTNAFKEAADKMTGPAREIFVEFLERSCTAEFSGFLLYKELGRRLKVGQ